MADKDPFQRFKGHTGLTAPEPQAKPILIFEQSQINKNRLGFEQEGRRLVGVKDVNIIFSADGTLTGQDIGGSVLGLDDLSRADSARVLFKNTTGSTVNVADFGLIGKPVYENTGQEGWYHDKFVDWDDIEKNGERTFELGNRFVMDKSQVEQLADYYWKLNRQKPHYYSLSFPGTLFYFEPGERYTVIIGGGGEKENINSVVECFSVSTSRPATGLGTTNVIFREIQQNWTQTSNWVARLIASGRTIRRINRGNVITVAPSDYVGAADYYCDGTADDVEIQTANDFLNDNYGGGTIQLVKGTYNIDAEVVLDNGVNIIGEGKNTLYKNTSNIGAGDAGLRIGGINTIVSDINFTNDGGGLSVNAMVDMGSNSSQIDKCFFSGNCDEFISCTSAANTMSITSCLFDGSSGTGSVLLDFRNTGLIFQGNTISGANHAKISIIMLGVPTASRKAVNISIINNTWLDSVSSDLIDIDDLGTNSTVTISSNSIYNCTVTAGTSIMYINTGIIGATISNNQIKNCGFTSIEGQAANEITAITVEGDNCTVIGNNIDNVSDTAIDITSNASYALVSSNQTFDNGQLIDRGDCESTTSPMIFGETVPVLSNATWARSAVQEFEGTYSYLFTKTVAAGTAATVFIVDSNSTSDLHGLITDLEYTITAWIYIPSGGILGSEIEMRLDDYQGSWGTSTVSPANTYDAWQQITLTRTIRSSATGTRIFFQALSAAAINELFYVDSIRLFPTGVDNSHSTNYLDNGTNTNASGNSWQ